MQNSKITKLKAQRAKQHRLVSQERHTQEIEALSDVKASIQDLYSLINDQDKFDANKLSEQIETLAKSLDIQDQVASIKEALGNLNPQVTVEKMDVAPLLEAIEANKPIPIDVSEMHKAIIEIRQRVQESSVVEQAPEEFQPVRRVVKVGNRLIFDDQPTTATRAGGGGSGGSSSGGLTDTELRATPVETTESNRYAVDGDDELIVHHKSVSHAQADAASNTRQVNAATDETALIINETYPYYFNGTNWDRQRGTASDGALVNLGTNNDVTVTSGTITIGNPGDIGTPSTYTTRIDEADATTTYIGTADPGTAESAASWQVKKIVSTNPTSIKFADGTSAFDNVWDDRASLTYS